MSIDISKYLSKVSEKFTPEYFEKCARKNYEDDLKYPENFSNWYYEILDFGKFDHAEIISNQVFSFEETELFKETDSIEQIKDWSKYDEVVKPTLSKMKPSKLYSIKNGCFSNKFNFVDCIADVNTLSQNLWKINYMSSMFDTGGFTELVVREYIPFDKDNCLTIYNGMPLRTEVRVFYNMNTKEIEYIEDYWNFDYCHNKMNNFTDKIVFEAFHVIHTKDIPSHKDEFDNICDRIDRDINTLKFSDKLNGIWSIDFMYERESDKLYLIDMARGFKSAYWDKNRIKKGNDNEIK